MATKSKKIEINRTLIDNIKDIISKSRTNIIRKVNNALVATYWEIGKQIVSNEHKNKIDNISSRQIILTLSKQLTEELGKGFSISNLFNMRKFHLEYPNIQTVSGQLNWSHICELLIIDDKEKRNYYKTEVNDADDNEPIGIILCAEKDEITAEYILNGIENNVFASKFTYVLPNKEILISEVENLLKKNN